MRLRGIPGVRLGRQLLLRGGNVLVQIGDLAVQCGDLCGQRAGIPLGKVGDVVFVARALVGERIALCLRLIALRLKH